MSKKLGVKKESQQANDYTGRLLIAQAIAVIMIRRRMVQNECFS